jgi:hypothetical protein
MKYNKAILLDHTWKRSNYKNKNSGQSFNLTQISNKFKESKKDFYLGF